MSSPDRFGHSLYLRNTPLSPPSAACSAMSHNRQPPYQLPTSEACSSPVNDNKGQHYAELWQACAGPLVSVPKPEQLVMYLPQGHIEQISASTSQKAELHADNFPTSDLSAQILCRVLDVQLSAEPETDEVKAQISLLPVSDSEATDSQPALVDEKPPSPISSPGVHMFCKTLTASDTSTHGGFSVPRKHANCLPPLDMTQFPPTQELEAMDLHGIKWRFRHIYRGQPKRHLLTTGWSIFVSQKKLVAGDAVIFLRGEDGELRVGIRRALRQQSTPPCAVLPNQSLQMGVIATATHAVSTRTPLSIYYTPRVSPAEFVIPLERYKSSLSINLVVGMRFKMKFETEDASERRYNGTITGVEDFDPKRWPSSNWRSLKVGWDEPTIYERHDRVSPWEIELCVNQAPPPNPVPPRCKRMRPSTPAPASIAEHSLVSSGRKQASFGSMLSANTSTVLQGQEPRTLGVFEDAFRGGHHPHLPAVHLSQSQHLRPQKNPLPWGGDKQGNGELLWGKSGQDFRGSYPFHSLIHTSQSQDQQQVPYDAYMKFSTGLPMPSHRNACNPLALSNQHSTTGAPGLGTEGSNWQARSVHLGGSSLQHMEDSSPSWLFNKQPSLQSPNVSSLATSNLGLFKEMSSIGLPQTMLQGRTAPPRQLPFSSSIQQKGPQEGEKESTFPQPVAAAGSGEAHKGCKLFGFSLTDPPPSKPRANVDVKALMVEQVAEMHSIQLNDSENEAEQLSKASSALDLSTTSSEPEFQKPTMGIDASKEGQCRGLYAGRSCTKVVKKGSIVGRGVDLSKLGGYDQLFEELERMFHLEGQLRDKEKGWQVAYSDSENDMLEVGDDPWGEFCTMARKIHILSREEVAQGSKRSCTNPLNMNTRRPINT